LALNNSIKTINFKLLRKKIKYRQLGTKSLREGEMALVKKQTCLTINHFNEGTKNKAIGVIFSLG
jgi:hypothetical protein